MNSDNAIAIPMDRDENDHAHLFGKYTYFENIEPCSEFEHMDVGSSELRGSNDDPKNWHCRADFYSCPNPAGVPLKFTTKIVAEQSHFVGSSTCHRARLHTLGEDQSTFSIHAWCPISTTLDLLSTSPFSCGMQLSEVLDDAQLLPGLIELPFYNPLTNIKSESFNVHKQKKSSLKPLSTAISLPMNRPSPNGIFVEIFRPVTQSSDYLYQLWHSQQISHRSLKPVVAQTRKSAISKNICIVNNRIIKFSSTGYPFVWKVGFKLRPFSAPNPKTCMGPVRSSQLKIHLRAIFSLRPFFRRSKTTTSTDDCAEAVSMAGPFLSLPIMTPQPGPYIVI